MSTKNTGKGPTNTKGTFSVYENASAGKETVEAALRAGTDAATKAFSMSKDSVEQVVKSVDEIASFNKGTVEALVHASNVTAKGIEAINAEVLAFSRATMEESLAAAKGMMTAKTLNEFIELQSRFAKSSLDAYLQQSTKLGELSAKVAQEAFEPLNARFQAAVEKFVKPVAA